MYQHVTFLCAFNLPYHLLRAISVEGDCVMKANVQRKARSEYRRQSSSKLAFRPSLKHMQAFLSGADNSHVME